MARPVRTTEDLGSSPRMRGTHGRGRGRRGAARFIPAHAGNTPTAAQGQAAGAVHPRACGEHSTSNGIAESAAGSSPRMRGTRAGRRGPPLEQRFIPAHAGNTWAPRPACSGIPVHPRACGEHAGRRYVQDRLAGSSPRMRGTLSSSAFPTDQPRFIPAHAGNTRDARRGTDAQTVHPRACGEHP